MMKINNIDELSAHYDQPKEGALKKELSSLDKHCKHFLSLSPFAVIATGGSDRLDASPRGGKPGFIKVLNDRELLIPDSKGNNRVDSLKNVVDTGKIALICMIPGVDETLRIRGNAVVSTNPDLLKHLNEERNPPKSCIHVHLETAFLHCAKAFMRSDLWNPDKHINRSDFPSMGEMMKDHIGHNNPIESREAMLKRYQQDI